VLLWANVYSILTSIFTAINIFKSPSNTPLYPTFGKSLRTFSYINQTVQRAHNAVLSARECPEGEKPFDKTKKCFPSAQLKARFQKATGTQDAFVGPFDSKLFRPSFTIRISQMIQ